MQDQDLLKLANTILGTSEQTFIEKITENPNDNIGLMYQYLTIRLIVEMIGIMKNIEVRLNALQTILTFKQQN